MRVLLVEDNKPLLRVIDKRLSEEGYSLDSCADGEEGAGFVSAYDYDLATLDIMLPNVSGLEILKAIKAKNPLTPVLLLTAKDSVSDKVAGLDAGADDYLVKPFAFDELLARIRALLRRQTDIESNVLSIADLSLDLLTRKVQRSSREIILTAKEFALLEYLLRNKQRVLTRGQIADHVWNYSFDSGTNIVDVYIRYLRRKIDDDEQSKLIQTIRGVGYALREEA
jgi:DNA-binding response OmpR family regulator